MTISASRVLLAATVAAALLVVAYELGARRRGSAPAAPGTATVSSETAAPPHLDDETQRLRYRMAISRQLEERKSLFVEHCWTPPAEGEPRAIKLVFHTTFDASGREVTRGISEIRGQARPEVANCIRQEPLGLRIPPPGQLVELDVGLVLP